MTLFLTSSKIFKWELWDTKCFNPFKFEFKELQSRKTSDSSKLENGVVL